LSCDLNQARLTLSTDSKRLVPGSSSGCGWPASGPCCHCSQCWRGARAGHQQSNPDANTDKEGNDKRWSKEGIIRFNQLRQLIIKDCAAHPEFVPKWLARERDSMVGGPTTRTNDEASMVDAHDDFVGSPINLQRQVLKDAAQQEDVVDDDSDHYEDDKEDDEDDEDDDDNFGADGTTV
jgi:hypothetical protein